MTPRLLLDENLRSEAIWTALLTWQEFSGKSLDIVRVGDALAPSLGSSDLALLAWAAEEGRIIVSQDRNSLIHYFAEYVGGGKSSPGILMLHGSMGIADLVEWLALIGMAGTQAEFANEIHWVP